MAMCHTQNIVPSSALQRELKKKEQQKQKDKQKKEEKSSGEGNSAPGETGKQQPLLSRLSYLFGTCFLGV